MPFKFNETNFVAKVRILVIDSFWCTICTISMYNFNWDEVCFSRERYYIVKAIHYLNFLLPVRYQFLCTCSAGGIFYQLFLNICFISFSWNAFIYKKYIIEWFPTVILHKFASFEVAILLSVWFTTFLAVRWYHLCSTQYLYSIQEETCGPERQAKEFECLCIYC